MSFGIKHKTKASRQSKSMLYGYRKLYSKYKNIFLKTLQMMLEKRFDTSSYQTERPLPTGKSEKIIELLKDGLGGKIMAKFVGLRPETYSYLIDDCIRDKNAKGTKKCLIK